MFSPCTSTPKCVYQKSHLFDTSFTLYPTLFCLLLYQTAWPVNTDLCVHKTVRTIVPDEYVTRRVDIVTGVTRVNTEIRVQSHVPNTVPVMCVTRQTVIVQTDVRKGTRDRDVNQVHVLLYYYYQYYLRHTHTHTTHTHTHTHTHTLITHTVITNHKHKAHTKHTH